MTVRHAECSCGRLTVEVEGDPVRVSMCHCLACQRRTGSPIAVQARFPRAAVTLRGRSASSTRIGDSGAGIVFSFCPECGATVCYRQDGVPDLVAIPVGAFADPAFPPPTVSVYEARRHPWLRVPEDVDRFD